MTLGELCQTRMDALVDEVWFSAGRQCKAVVGVTLVRMRANGSNGDVVMRPLSGWSGVHACAARFQVTFIGNFPGWVWQTAKRRSFDLRILIMTGRVIRLAVCCK